MQGRGPTDREPFAAAHKRLVDPSQTIAINGNVRHHWPGHLIAHQKRDALYSGMILRSKQSLQWHGIPRATESGLIDGICDDVGWRPRLGNRDSSASVRGPEFPSGRQPCWKVS